MDTKLATIICADVIGYSALMQQNESATLTRLNASRNLIDPIITAYKGRLFNTGGDSIFVEFASAVDAVKFGIDMQTKMNSTSNGLKWRVGIHVGEVWIYGTNLMGEAVNLAARTESLADYSGVTMTDDVYNLVKGKLQNYEFISRGKQEFKNIDPREIWSIVLPFSTPNPFLNKAPRPQISTNDTLSHREYINKVLSDQSAKNRTLNDALNLKRDNKLGPAVRVLMHRVTRQDMVAGKELVDMYKKNLVPRDLTPYVLAVLDEYCQKSESDLSMAIADIFLKENLKSKALKFLKRAALVNEEAQFAYAMIIFEDANSSQNEIDGVIADLTESAKNRRIPAMMNLARYYQQRNDKKNTFIWLYAARSQHNTEAQTMLEQLNKNLSRVEFTNYKTEADALVDEIKFIHENKMRN